MATNEKPLTQDSSQATDNTDKSSFRLVAIRPYSESSKDALKALHPDTTYFLVGDYKDKYENGKWVGIEKSSEVESLPHDFFSVNVLDENMDPLKMPFVNISAIVGKNGCGKSSLIEFLIRLINNFAIKKEFSSFQYYKYAEETYGRIYYETNNHPYYIDCSTSGEENDGSNKKNFFYSIISNYSLYAYNSMSYKNTWLQGLFHKNDSYQMPIVITPMRDQGNIDINVENDLAKLRLLSIFSQAENSSGRKISDKKYADGVAMSLKTSSKLFSYLKKWFSVNKSEDLEFRTRINSFKEYMTRADTKDFFSNDVLKYEIDFWTEFSNKKFLNKYIYIIDHANSIAESLLPINIDYGQMYEYLDLFPQIIKHESINLSNKVEETIKALKVHSGYMNALQFQRLMMIIYICDLWDNDKTFADINWAQEFSKSDINHKCKEARLQSYLYVIYKTISIFETYEPYINIFFDSYLNRFNLFNVSYQYENRFTKNLRQCYNYLFDSNRQIKVNYKSLKLRQALNFLTVEGLAEEYDFASNKRYNIDNPYYLSFDKLHNIIKKNREIDDDENMSLLPPPIFSTEIIVKENNNKFYLSNMSSGELQMLYSVGALIYHLRNLDYNVSDKMFIQYKNVSIVLEEVEQYFHPEYQQDYVHTLLKFIANACFKNIKGINILLVTHSPFVLSDIPKQNVLFLKEGMPTYSMQQNTFGANIHSMLKNGFFLNGLPIGEFAKEKINELTKKLNNGLHIDDDSILDTIKLIGEPIVKSQLLKMYNDYKLAYRYEDRIKELEAKIAKLEKEHD